MGERAGVAAEKDKERLMTAKGAKKDGEEPQGLKPAFILPTHAALKGRSSTVDGNLVA